MKKALIHIGTHKTGTTSIQGFLKRAELEGINYPAVRGPNHNFLYQVYKCDDESFGAFTHFFGTLSKEDQKYVTEVYRSDFL